MIRGRNISLFSVFLKYLVLNNLFLQFLLLDLASILVITKQPASNLDQMDRQLIIKQNFYDCFCFSLRIDKSLYGYKEMRKSWLGCDENYKEM